MLNFYECNLINSNELNRFIQYIKAKDIKIDLLISILVY